jgi:hypothetical protein
MTIDWSTALAEQLRFHWEAHLRPRLEGLTDDEYFWEPAPGCWSLRPDGVGAWRMDGHDGPSPTPPPLTTIAWRMTHLSVECFESRYRAFFAGEGPNQWSAGQRIVASGDLPGSAAAGVAYLTAAYTRWSEAVAALSEDELTRPLGEKGADFAEFPMAELVLHISREAMHHGAEICLMRDLYRTTAGSG